jgi:hypothetical protein
MRIGLNYWCLSSLIVGGDENPTLTGETPRLKYVYRKLYNYCDFIFNR